MPANNALPVIKIEKAKRGKTRLFIGLCGPSGGGKTLSALRLATGMAQGGPIVVLDTERGRARQYAPPEGRDPEPPLTYDFLVAELEPPFSPQHYRAAIEAIEKIEPAVLIIDSMTHEWDGEGGMREWVDEIKAEQERRYGKVNEHAAWAKPKFEHNKLVNTVLRSRCHLIICMRAREKSAQVKGPDGRSQIVDIGWAPICEKDFPFELTVNLLVGVTGKKGAASLDFDWGKLPENMQKLIRPGEQLTEEVGRRLVLWAEGKIDDHGRPVQPAPAAASPVEGGAGPAEAAVLAAAEDGEPPAPAKRKPLVVYGAEGKLASSTTSGSAWLEAYRAEVARTPVEQKVRVVELNHAILRRLAARASEKAPEELRKAFENELAAAEAVLANALLDGAADDEELE